MIIIIIIIIHVHVCVSLGISPITITLHVQVIDKDPSKARGQFEDTSEVQKFEISAEAYGKRTGKLIRTYDCTKHNPIWLF